MLFTAEVSGDIRLNHESIIDTEQKYDEVDLTKIVNTPRSKIPAVTHVDMSARLQTVIAGNPVYGVLKEYFRISGVPVLVNTSFNVRNEPIVESPLDAIRCFMTTDIDVLAIGRYLVLKENQSKHLRERWNGLHFIGDLD
jgi:carbamoyltransferase